MPKSNGRPKNRQPKNPLPKVIKICVCGGKATKYGPCLRCLDSPISRVIQQAHDVYLPSRAERRTRS